MSAIVDPALGSTNGAYPRVDRCHKTLSSRETLNRYIQIVSSQGEKYYGPRAEIPQSYFVDRKAPLLYCGWAWTDTYVLEYAIHHKLTRTGYGRPFTEEDLHSTGNELYLALFQAAKALISHFFDEYGVLLKEKRPLSPDHDGMFVLYSNREAIAKYKFDTDYRGLDYGRVVPLIHKAMNEGGNKSDFLWWSCFGD